MTDATIELFETLADVPLYCWVFGCGLLLFWFGKHRLTVKRKRDAQRHFFLADH